MYDFLKVELDGLSLKSVYKSKAIRGFFQMIHLILENCNLHNCCYLFFSTQLEKFSVTLQLTAIRSKFLATLRPTSYGERKVLPNIAKYVLRSLALSIQIIYQQMVTMQKRVHGSFSVKVHSLIMELKIESIFYQVMICKQ